MNLLILTLTLAATAHAQNLAPLPPPPSPASVISKVERGGTAAIRLKAGGRAPGAVQFLIRTPPEFGTLSPLRRLSRTEAEITYSHSGQSGAEDVFLYAVQAADSPVSAPAEVRIFIEDAPARLEAGPALDFGTVAPGSRRTLEAVWSNRGGTAMKIRIPARPPFFVQTTPLVPPNARVKIPVTFAPETPGDFEQELRPEGAPQAALPVFGRARKPIAIETAEPPTFQDDILHLTIRNVSGTPLPLHIEYPPGETFAAPAILPAEESLTLTLPWPEAISSPALPIRIQAGDYTEILEAAAGPGRAELKGPALLDFGKLAPEGSSTLPFTLTNIGRAEARMRVETPPGLRIIPDPASIVLPPGTSRQFEAILEPLPNLGKPQALRIFPTQGPMLEVPIRAEVAALPPTPTPSPSPPPHRVPTRELLARAQQVETTDSFLPETQLPPPSNIRQLPSPPFHLVLTWPQTEPPAARFVVEARALRPSGEDSPPAIHWNIWPRARFENRKGMIVATLPGAAPHSLWFLRVRALDREGRSSQPTPTFQAVAPGNPLPWGLMLALPVAIAAAVLLWRLWRRQVRQRLAMETRRLARLEHPDA